MTSMHKDRPFLTAWPNTSNRVEVKVPTRLPSSHPRSQKQQLAATRGAHLIDTLQSV